MPTGKTIEANWSDIRLAICGGMSYGEAEKSFGIASHVIRKRAQRDRWPTARAVKTKARTLIAERRSENNVSDESQRVTTVLEPDITERLADSWVDRAEKHKLLAFNIAHGALKGAKVPQIRHWGDIDTADKMARRAAGLDSTEKNTVNIGLTLVNQRITAVTQESQSHSVTEAEIIQDP